MKYVKNINNLNYTPLNKYVRILQLIINILKQDFESFITYWFWQHSIESIFLFLVLEMSSCISSRVEKYSSSIGKNSGESLTGLSRVT